MATYKSSDLIQLVTAIRTILLYGPPFTGKTYSLWTLVKYLKKKGLGPLHLHDLDGKVESLVRKCEKEGLLDHLVVIRQTLPDRVTADARRQAASKDLWLMFEKDFNVYHDNMDARTGGWKESYKAEAPGAIIIDSLTAYNDIVLEYVIAMVGHDIGAPGTDARNDFGKAMEKMKETVKSLKSLPCITGWIAHETLQQDAVGNITLFPNITGNLRGQLAKLFNCVLYSTTESKGDKTEYKWQVAPKNWVRSAGVTSRDDLGTFIDQNFEIILT